MPETSSTIIRPLTREDLSATRRWRNDPRIWEPALGRRFPITELDEDRWFERLAAGEFPTQLVWAIAGDEDQVIGLVRLDDIHWIHRTATFGLWIGPEYWGGGHAARATRMICDYANRSLGLRQLRLSVLVGNKAARSVYLSNGFVDEALLRAAVFSYGKPSDVQQMVAYLEPLESGT